MVASAIPWLRWALQRLEASGLDGGSEDAGTRLRSGALHWALALGVAGNTGRRGQAGRGGTGRAAPLGF